MEPSLERERKAVQAITVVERPVRETPAARPEVNRMATMDADPARAGYVGESFGGTRLYLKREEGWGAYTIRPNQSQNIAMAEAWLAKRD